MNNKIIYLIKKLIIFINNSYKNNNINIINNFNNNH